MKNIATPRRSAFTLVEILVVLAIIGILAAILFPAFKRAQESAHQTNCASNLHQIGLAVLQYKQDTRRYPDSLLDLLPEGAEYDGGTASDTVPQGAALTPNATIVRGTSYLRGGTDILLCQDDEVTDRPRSSYGALTKSPQPTYDPTTGLSTDADAGRYVFNFYGYRTDGFILSGPAGVAAADTNAIVAGKHTLMRNPDAAYDEFSNPMKYSLSNIYAPASTIITHCVYHRPQTANDVALPAELYKTPTPEGSNGARDIILRLDGAAKAVDVSGTDWHSSVTTDPSKWQIQN